MKFRYKRDRLALELKKLREALEVATSNDIANIVIECRALLSQLQEVITDNQDLSAEDFMTKKKS